MMIDSLLNELQRCQMIVVIATCVHSVKRLNSCDIIVFLNPTFSVITLVTMRAIVRIILLFVTKNLDFFRQWICNV